MGQITTQTNAQVILAQETRLDAAGQLLEEHYMRDMGWTTSFGPPCGYKTQKGAATTKIREGGVALLAKHPYKLLPVGREAEASQRLWEGGRWNRAALPIHIKGLGHRYLHLVSAYCHSGFDQITHSQREQMIEDMFMDASAIGNQPTIISADINTTDQKSTALRQALASGIWTDAATLFATDSDPPPTYHSDATWQLGTTPTKFAPSRPERIFLNGAAIALCTNLDVTTDYNLPGHKALVLTLDIDLLRQPHLSYSIPYAYPIHEAPEIDADERERLLTTAMDLCHTTFDAINAIPCTTLRWEKFGELMDTYFNLRCAPYTDTNLAKSFGRSQPFQPYQKLPTPQVRRAKTGTDHTTNQHQSKLDKMARQLREISLLLDGTPDFTQQLRCSNTWDKLRRAGKQVLPELNGTWSKSFSAVPHRLLHHLKKVLHDKADAYANTCYQQRRDAYKTKLQFDWTDGGRRIYTSIKEQRLGHARAIRATDGSLLTQPQAMVNEIASRWQTMYTKPSLCHPQALLAAIGHDLPTAPCELPTITGEDLLEQFQRMQSQRTPTTDAWRQAELADVPLTCASWMANQLLLCEQGAQWPQQLTTGLTSCIPKPGPTDDLSTVSTGEILAQSGMQTRPITNLSPIWTAYTSIRFRQMAPWREQVLPPEMYGARSSREATSAVLDFTLQLEQAHRDDYLLLALAIDKTKFFDTMEYDLCHTIMASMGAPPILLSAMGRFYDNLSTYYKAEGALAGPYTRRNGFVQGCTWSVQAAQCLMCAWHVWMRNHAHTASFLDDSRLHVCQHPDEDPGDTQQRLLQAWAHSEQFDTLTGLTSNTDKTKCLTTQPSIRANLRRQLDSGGYTGIQIIRDTVILGIQITGYGAPKLDKIRQRCDAAAASADAIARRKFPYHIRTTLLQTAALPKLYWGTEHCPVARSSLLKLRRQIHGIIWPNTFLRSPAVTFTLLTKGHRTDPCQAVPYYVLNGWIRTLRREPHIRRKLTDLWPSYSTVAAANSTGSRPGANFWRYTQQIGWTPTACPTKFRSRSGQPLDLLHDPLRWIQHILREDLRDLTWHTTPPRRMHEGCQQGLEYTITTALLRRENAEDADEDATPNTEALPPAPPAPTDRLPTDEDAAPNTDAQPPAPPPPTDRPPPDADAAPNTDALPPAPPAPTDRQPTDEDAAPNTDALPPAPPPPTDRPLTDEEKRMLRRLLGGAIPTYAKLYEHTKVTTPRCPCCTTGEEETIEHILWHCPTWQPQRQQIHDRHGSDIHLQLPPSVLRALVLPKRYDWQASARQETPEDRHHPPPPWHLPIPPHSEWIEEGHLLTASDGACPNQQGLQWTRRSGQSLYYGPDHPWNCAWPTSTAAQSSQRAELEAAVRWAAWADRPAKLLTDSAMVIKGLQGIRTDPLWNPNAHTHEDLWTVLCKAVRAKPYLRWEKVKGHRALSDCTTERDYRLREYNNAADALAVEVARANQPPPAPLLADAAYWTDILPRLQRMAVAILLERHHLLRGITTAMPSEPPATDPTDPTLHSQARDDHIQELTTTPLDRLYPLYPWQSNLTNTAATTPPTSRYTPRPLRPLRSWWPYDSIHFHALQWYLHRLLWPAPTPNPTPHTSCAWVELMLDYEATTHLQIKTLKGQGPPTLEQRARAFAAMVRSLTRHTHQPLTTTYTYRTPILKTLGYTGTAYPGLPHRPHLLRPAQVGRWLAEHAAAHRLAGRAPTLKGTPPDTRNPGPQLWKLHQPTRRRLRQKTCVHTTANSMDIRLRRSALLTK